MDSLKTIVEKMSMAARKSLWDPLHYAWVSGNKRQISWASWAWMVLAGTCTGNETRESYRRLIENPKSIKPKGPYLYHHVVDALFTCGLKDEAINILKKYWGGMIDKGATTFWEVYDPDDDRLSPYKDHHLNSYCHAWSCTPAYFIRRYRLT